MYREKEIFYRIHSISFGDTIASTPTLRKLYHSYGKRINVVTHAKYIFENNPYVNRILSFSEYDDLVIENSDFELLESFINRGKKNSEGVEKKFATIDLRQSHSMDLGFQLLPEEMSYDYRPGVFKLDVDLPDEYIVLHVTSNWPNRTWSYDSWYNLIEWLNKNKIFTITVGKDYNEVVHQSVSNNPILKKCPTFDNIYGIDLTNQGDLDDMWHVINQARALVTMDSGPLHLAGTTDTNIIQLGSALDWRFRAPYRNGSQTYKYNFVGGSCQMFCNNDLKYSVKTWGTIQSVPPLNECLEGKSTFECHPPLSHVKEIIGNVIGKNMVDVEHKEAINKQQEEILTGDGPTASDYSFYDFVGESRRKSANPNSPIYLIDYVDGKLTYKKNRDHSGKFYLFSFDSSTGLRRDVMEIEAGTLEYGIEYWWVPSPGNESEDKKNLGPVRFVAVKDGKKVLEDMFETPGGTKIIAGGKEIKYPNINDNLYPTFWEIYIRDDYRLTELNIPEGGTIIDIGSNYGLFTLRAFDLFKPDKIIAVEPNPICSSTAEAIFNYYGVDVVETIKAGVSSEKILYIDKPDSIISALGKATPDMRENTMKVEGITIDEILDRVDKIDLLKVDCEGMEEYVMRNISNENSKKIMNIVLEYHTLEIRENVANRLLEYGFSIIGQIPSSGIGVILASRK